MVNDILKANGVMVDLDEFAMAKLAREIAMNIRNYKAVFKDFNISEEDYYEIEKVPFYQKAKEQFTLEWNSALSAADRVKLISAAYAEVTLPAITRRMLDDKEPLSSVIDAAKYLTKNAGIGEPKLGPAAGERFVIQINIGGKTETYDKALAISSGDDVAVIEHEPKPTTNGVTNGVMNGVNSDGHDVELGGAFSSFSGDGYGAIVSDVHNNLGKKGYLSK